MKRAPSALAETMALLLAMLALGFFCDRVWRGVWFLPFVDESEHLLGGRMLNAGAILYRGFVSQHGPVTFMLTQAYGAVFGWHRPNYARLISAFLALCATGCIATARMLPGRIDRLRAMALFLALIASMWLMQAIYLVNYHVIAGFFMVAGLALFTVPAWLGNAAGKASGFAAGWCFALVVATAYSFGPGILLLATSTLWACAPRTRAAFIAGGAACVLCVMAWMLRFADFTGYLAFHFAENQFVFSHFLRFTFGNFLHGLVPSFRPDARVHALGLLCCAGAFFLFFCLNAQAGGRRAGGRRAGGRKAGPILLGYAGMLALCARGGTLFQDGCFLVGSLGLFALAVPAALRMVSVPPLTGNVLCVLCMAAAEFLGRHALNSPFGMDRAQIVAQPRTDIGLSDDPFYARIRALMPEGGHILSVPYAPYVYLRSGCSPLDRYFCYLPWDAAYAKAPWFGQTHDICADLPANPPALIYFDRWKVWNRWDMRDYAPCFFVFLKAHYRQDTLFHDLYARTDIAPVKP